MSKQVSNSQLIECYVCHGSPMNQILLIQAMNQYCEFVMTHQEEILKAYETSIIHGPAWIEAAKHWIELHDARSKGHVHIVTGSDLGELIHKMLNGEDPTKEDDGTMTVTE